MISTQKLSKRRSYTAEWKRQNPEKVQRYHFNQRLKKRGITSEQYEELLSAQNNCCAICKTSSPSGRGDWHIDHCHKTGIVRGLLCYQCNSVLGYAKDSPDILTAAISYLAANTNH